MTELPPPPAPLGLQTQVLRFLVTGGLSACVDYGLYVGDPARRLSVVRCESWRFLRDSSAATGFREGPHLTVVWSNNEEKLYCLLKADAGKTETKLSYAIGEVSLPRSARDSAISP